MEPRETSTMAEQGSITYWIARLKDGDAEAPQKLWEAYFLRVVALARTKLLGKSRAIRDEEDVALSAFQSFFARAQKGIFPQLSDRLSLWPLLVAITRNKCVDHVRFETREKRGGAQGGLRLDELQEDLREMLSTEPSPEFSVVAAEELGRLLGLLQSAGDADLVPIALAKLEGHDTVEIAAKIGCVRRTVERKLQLIRRLWSEEEKA